MPERATSSLQREAVVERVDVVLRRSIAARRAAAAKLHPDYERLWAAIDELMFAGGKRIRPYLVVLAFQGLGGKGDDIYEVAAAHECLHLGLLVHDDVMDRDYARHGVPNIAGQYLKHYKEQADAEHLAHSAAILAGDLLIAEAYDLLARSQFPPAAMRDAVAAMSRAVHEVAGGQLLDMEAVTRPLSVEHSLRVAAFKTASYSFVGPMQVAAALAEAPAKTRQLLAQFGEAVGIGFQLADDLLGLYGTEAAIGKPVLSDMHEGKATYLIALTRERLDPVDQGWLDAHWGDAEATEEDLAHVRQLVERSGARAHVEADLESYAGTARALLGQLGLTAPATLALEALIAKSLWRKF